MIKSVLLVGVGGQGTILISKILSAGLMEMGYDVKMSEIHGMSQRGGSVTTQIKYGDKVFAPNIGLGSADLIISFEKAEALRALPFLKPEGMIITDDREIYPMPVLMGTVEYPHDALSALIQSGVRLVVIKAAEVAEGLGSIRAQNIVLLGKLVKSMGFDRELFTKLVEEYVPPKAKELNRKAFDAGYDM